MNEKEGRRMHGEEERRKDEMRELPILLQQSIFIAKVINRRRRFRPNEKWKMSGRERMRRNEDKKKNEKKGTMNLRGTFKYRRNNAFSLREVINRGRKERSKENE